MILLAKETNRTPEQVRTLFKKNPEKVFAEMRFIRNLSRGAESKNAG